jgi:lipopolysaccharide export system permease protein
MSFLASRLGLYIIARVLGGVMIALACVLASILLIDLVEQMRTVGTRTDLTLLEAARLTLLKAPMLVEQTLPFVVLAGTMMAVIGLNRASELVAMRAAGVSAWRFLAPAALTGAALGALAVVALSPLGAHLYAQFEMGRTEAMSGPARPGPAGNGIWIREGRRDEQVVIQAAGIDASGTTLQQATFMFFEQRQGVLRFTHRIRAKMAQLLPGHWQLTDVVEASPGSRPTAQPYLAIESSLDSSEVINRFVNPATLSFWELPNFISEARAAGFAPTRYELKFQTLLAYPMLLAAMASLGAAFSLQLQRLGNLARWGATGVGIGLLLFFYGQLAGAFAITQTVPTAVAAWSAPLAGMFIALAIIAFMEDG